MALITRTLQLVGYAEPQTYMALFFIERAELQCGDHPAYKMDLKSAQQWSNQVRRYMQLEQPQLKTPTFLETPT